MTSVNFTERKKILELINQAPGNYFGLKGTSGVKISPAYYKDKRSEFYDKIADWMASDLAEEGIYQVLNGTNKKTSPIFMIQKGSLAASPKIIIQEKDNSDINLVKENAELKAKLHYLELQLAELQEQLSDQEAELADQPENPDKPNPWYALAEQLAPAAGQIIAALANKYLNNEPTGQGATQPRPMAMQYVRPNVKFDPGTVPGPGSYYPDYLQGNDNTRPDFRSQSTETEPET